MFTLIYYYYVIPEVIFYKTQRMKVFKDELVCFCGRDKKTAHITYELTSLWGSSHAEWSYTVHIHYSKNY